MMLLPATPAASAWLLRGSTAELVLTQPAPLPPTLPALRALNLQQPLPNLTSFGHGRPGLCRSLRLAWTYGAGSRLRFGGDTVWSTRGVQQKRALVRRRQSCWPGTGPKQLEQPLRHVVQWKWVPRQPRQSRAGPGWCARQL